MTPAKHQVEPTSTRGRIRVHFALNPKPLSAGELAALLPDPNPDRASGAGRGWSQEVSNVCARMARSGELVRLRTSEKAMGPGVKYALPGTDLSVVAATVKPD